jgi:hypothetical protein
MARRNWRDYTSVIVVAVATIVGILASIFLSNRI